MDISPADASQGLTPLPVEPASSMSPSAMIVTTTAPMTAPTSHSSARKFGAKWELKYAVAVTERDASGAPTRAICLMCQTFDKEALVGAKRKRTSRVRNFTSPWRPDNMKRHMEQQHPMRWDEYQKLGDNDKRAFFTSPRAPREDLAVVTSGSDVVPSLPISSTPTETVSSIAAESRTFLIDRDIVSELIGDVLFEATSADRRNAWNVPVTFTMQEETSLDDETGDVDLNDSRYVAKVDSLLQYNTCLKYVAMGVSLAQAVALYQQTAEETGMDTATQGIAFTQQQLAVLCRVACAVNLQTLKNTLHSVWAFSIALERGDGAGSPYLDVRVRLEHDGRLHDYHLIAVPIREEMPQAIGHQTDAVVKCLDVVAPAWRTQLIGISTNGSAAQLSVSASTLVNRLKDESVASIFCEWGIVEQFEQVVEKAFSGLCNKLFMSILTGLTGHLRRQRALIRDMNGEMCPKFEEDKWRSMAHVFRWFSEHRGRLLKFVKEKPTDCSPGMEWWVTVIAVNTIMDRVNLTMAQLRGPVTPSSLRREDYLTKLVTDLAEMTGASGPLTAPRPPVDQANYEIGEYTLNPNAALLFLKEQGSFAVGTMNYLMAEFPACCQAAVDSTAQFVLSIIALTHQIVVDCNQNGGLTSNPGPRIPLRTNMPPFLPQVLCRMRNQEFVTEVQLQRVRLLQHFTIDQIEQIEDQHRSLRTAYQLDDHVSQQLNALPARASFSEAWKDGRFGGRDCRLLRGFCGALATATSDPHVLNIPRNAAFSLINWRRSPFGLSLIDFSLEAILHAQQYCSLSRLREKRSYTS